MMQEVSSSARRAERVSVVSRCTYPARLLTKGSELTSLRCDSRSRLRPPTSVAKRIVLRQVDAGVVLKSETSKVDDADPSAPRAVLPARR